MDSHLGTHTHTEPHPTPPQIAFPFIGRFHLLSDWGCLGRFPEKVRFPENVRFRFMLFGSAVRYGNGKSERNAHVFVFLFSIMFSYMLRCMGTRPAIFMRATPQDIESRKSATRADPRCHIDRLAKKPYCASFNFRSIDDRRPIAHLLTTSRRSTGVSAADASPTPGCTLCFPALGSALRAGRSRLRVRRADHGGLSRALRCGS